MKFLVYKDIMTRRGNPVTWVEAGKYDVVRVFDSNRVLIELYTPLNKERQLTLVRMHEGRLSVT